MPGKGTTRVRFRERGGALVYDYQKKVHDMPLTTPAKKRVLQEKGLFESVILGREKKRKEKRRGRDTLRRGMVTTRDKGKFSVIHGGKKKKGKSRPAGAEKNGNGEGGKTLCFTIEGEKKGHSVK